MIVEYRVMPEDGEIEYSDLEQKTRETVDSYDEKLEVLEVKEDPVGFGLKAVRIKFQMDEKLGSEELENKLAELPEVGEVTVTLMDRL